MNTYIVHTIRGLEQVCLQELQENLSIEVLKILPKKIVLVSKEAVSKFQKLRTIDDVSILVAEFPFERERFQNLSHFVELVSQLDFSNAREVISTIRELDNTFSVTVTAPNLKGISQKEIQEHTANAIQAKTQWQYTELNHMNFDVRINIEEKKWFASIRLFAKPLYEREYSNLSHTISLRSTIAAALVYLLGQNRKGKLLVDNFCGTGTILCEASQFGYKVMGGDTNSAAVVDAKLNLQKCHVGPKNVHVQDALRTKWTDNQFDVAVSNLPWNEKVKVKSLTELFKDLAKEYRRIMKPDGTLCFLSKRADLLVKCLKKEFPGAKIERTDISFHGQDPSIVVVRN